MTLRGLSSFGRALRKTAKAGNELGCALVGLLVFTVLLAACRIPRSRQIQTDDPTVSLLITVWNWFAVSTWVIGAALLLYRLHRQGKRRDE